jgi:2-polyprenyl-3-methyl-5-hydroxy-6-metoxy-1,4-benzoquinol methylase
VTARYDDVADWYLSWVGSDPGLICDPDTGLMPARLAGERWLDVACGPGRTSRELARRGAAVVGVDISGRQIDTGRAGLPSVREWLDRRGGWLTRGCLVILG